MDPELNGAASGGSPAPAAAPAPSPAPAPSSPSPAPSPSPASAVSSASAGAGAAPTPATPAAAEYQGVRDALAGYGVDLRTQFQDDHAALQHLALAYRQSQQGNQLAQYGQRYMQHAGEFEQFLAQRQQAAAAQQAQQQNWFKAPEYDQRWQHQITRDPASGELRAVPGAPPDVVAKYTAWQQHQVDFQQKMASDPIGTLKPGLEQVARQMAEQAIQQHLGNFQEQTAAQSFVSEHSSWLHARDGQGNVLRDPYSGREQLSPMGQHFLGYVKEAEQVGLRNVADVQRYALRALKADVAMAQLQQFQAGAAAPAAPGTPALPPGQAQKDAFLAAAAAGHRPNAGGSVAPVMPNGASVSQNASINARDRLTRAFQAQGYNLSTPIDGQVAR